MKSILLTTTALVAFAGAAAAEGHTAITFSGDVTLGYNDDQSVADEFTGGAVIGDNRGFYWEGTLGVNMTAALDNGVTAGAQFEVDFVDGEDVGGTGEPLTSGDYVLSLTTEGAGLFFGDTQFAAFSRWQAAGDMESDGFSEADGETALRGDFTVAGVDTSVSYVIGNNNRITNPTEDLNQLSIGARGSFGNFGFSAAYQAETDEAAGFYSNDAGTNGDNGDFSDREIFGLSANTTFAGATLTLAYAQRSAFGTAAETSSTGVQVAYPFGPVTATAYYVVEDYAGDEDNYGVRFAYADGPISVALDYDYDQGTNKLGLDGSYDLGNGLTVLAGVFDQSDSQNAVTGVATPASDGTDFYVAGVYDLGGGAELLVSYTDAETADAIADDEVGAPDYQVGTTVAVTFTF